MMIPDQTAKPRVYSCQSEALSARQHFTSPLQRNLDFAHHKHANLINKSYTNREYLTGSRPAAEHRGGAGKQQEYI